MHDVLKYAHVTLDHQAHLKDKNEDTIPVKILDPNRLAEQTIRRLCRKNPRTGKAKVSDEIVKQFWAGSSSRDDLIRMYLKAGGNKEPRSTGNLSLTCWLTVDWYIQWWFQPHSYNMSLCFWAKDRFVRQAELKITQSKKGSVKVLVGYYTEKGMKDTLKWDAFLDRTITIYINHFQ